MVIAIIIVIAVVLLDIISKILVMNNMSLNESITVIPHLLKFKYLENTGMAFSMFSDSTAVLFVISVIATIIIAYLMKKYVDFKNRKLLSVSIALILAGTIGNMIDRFLTLIGVRDGVVDFLQLYIGNTNIVGGSTFNIADASLSIGCALLVIDLIIMDTIREKRQRKKELDEKDNS